MERIDNESALIITADHGCDPTFTKHTDHTRERVPLLVYSPSLKKGVFLGMRDTFADVGATVLEWFGMKEIVAGRSFLSELR
jgi:phosphopentomutase